MTIIATTSTEGTDDFQHTIYFQPPDGILSVSKIKSIILALRSRRKRKRDFTSSSSDLIVGLPVATAGAKSYSSRNMVHVTDWILRYSYPIYFTARIPELRCISSHMQMIYHKAAWGNQPFLEEINQRFSVTKKLPISS